METIQARKLGEFLVDLGVLSKDEILEAIQIASQINLPLGRALVLSNKLPETQLRTLLQIQALLRENALDLEKARQVFSEMKSSRLSLSEALRNAGVSSGKQSTETPRSSLATLLLAAEVVSKAQVEEALKLGFETGRPVGRILAISGIVNHAVLARALEIQVMIREGKMSYSQAVDLLKAESLRILPVEQTAEQRGLSRQEPSKRVRLGELLMLSGVLTESDMLNVLELGLTNPKPLGDILIEMGMISKPVLEMALKLQGMISAGSLDIRAAAAALQELVNTGIYTDPHKFELTEEAELRLGDLLKQTGLVDNDDIQEAIDLSSTYPAMIGKMLLVAGSIDEGTLLAALRCQFLMRNKAISMEDARDALLYAQRHRISLDDALEELGIKVSSAGKSE